MFQQLKNKEAQNFGRSFLNDNSEPFLKYQDPTYFGFKILFDFNKINGLLADASNINSASAYLTRIGDKVRLNYLQTFINLLRNISTQTAWFFDSISGLDEAWKRDYNMPLLADKMLTITCRESIDLRMTALIDLYRKACFDWVNRREVVPINLRLFEMTVYVYDYRIFNDFEGRNDELGNSKKNDLLKLFGTKDVNFEATDYLNIGRTTNRIVYTFKNCEFQISEAPHLADIKNSNDSEIISQSIAIKYQDVEEDNVYNMYFGGYVSDDTVLAIDTLIKQDVDAARQDDYVRNVSIDRFSYQTQPTTEKEDLGSISENSEATQPTDRLGDMSSSSTNNRLETRLTFADNIVLSSASLLNLLGTPLGNLLLQNTLTQDQFNQIAKLQESLETNQDSRQPDTIAEVIQQSENNRQISILDFIQNTSNNFVETLPDTIATEVQQNLESGVIETIEQTPSNNTQTINQTTQQSLINSTNFINESIELVVRQTSTPIGEIDLSTNSTNTISTELELTTNTQTETITNSEFEDTNTFANDLAIDLQAANTHSLQLGNVFTNLANQTSSITDSINQTTNNKLETIETNRNQVLNLPSINLENSQDITNVLTQNQLETTQTVSTNSTDKMSEKIDTNIFVNKPSLELKFSTNSNKTETIFATVDSSGLQTVGKVDDVINSNSPISKKIDENIYSNLTENYKLSINSKIENTTQIVKTDNELVMNFDTKNPSKQSNARLVFDIQNSVGVLKDGDVINFVDYNLSINFNENVKETTNNPASNLNGSNLTVTENQTQTENGVINQVTNNPQGTLQQTRLDPFIPDYINIQKIN